jgi:hypothetical protein
MLKIFRLYPTVKKAGSRALMARLDLFSRIARSYPVKAQIQLMLKYVFLGMHSLSFHQEWLDRSSNLWTKVQNKQKRSGTTRYIHNLSYLMAHTISQFFSRRG